MKRRTARDLTLDEFEDWRAASGRFEAVAKAADEGGGPSLSLVPTPDSNEVWPTDLLPAAAGPDGASPDTFVGLSPEEAMAFDGVALEDSRKRELQ